MIIAIRHVKVLATMPSWLAYQEVLDGNREIQSLVVTGPFNPRAKFKPTSTQHTNGRYVCYINFGIFPNFGAGKDDREKDAGTCCGPGISVMLPIRNGLPVCQGFCFRSQFFLYSADIRMI